MTEHDLHDPASKQDQPAPEHSEWVDKAATLVDALPFMHRYAGSVCVVKYGGNAMGDPACSREFARDIALMKQIGCTPVVVHGGGPQISAMLDRLRIRSSYVDGLRVTDRDTVEIVEMVLSGSINKQVVSAINSVGGRAIGLSGKDGGLIKARKLRRTQRDPGSNIEKILDLGFVGEPTAITPEVLEPFETSAMIPVIAPIGAGEHGETLNINADTAAGAIAAALGAKRLFLLTDVPGVLDADGALIESLNVAEARALIEDGAVSGGMIPKLETCIAAVENGVEAAVVLDGRVPHALLLEAFTPRGAGTLISED